MREDGGILMVHRLADVPAVVEDGEIPMEHMEVAVPAAEKEDEGTKTAHRQAADEAAVPAAE